MRGLPYPPERREERGRECPRPHHPHPLQALSHRAPGGTPAPRAQGVREDQHLPVL